MRKESALTYPYSVVLNNKNKDLTIYPYLRNPSGDKEMFCVSPIHGRSYIVGQHDDGRYVVSKGNGLNYTQHSFLNTGEMGNDTWGLLLRQDAVRDFKVGIEIADLGIKTNIMEYVVALDVNVRCPKGNVIQPYLLQYSVECPYRIADAPFMSIEKIREEVDKWDDVNDRHYKEKYMIAANVLIRNLNVLHSHGILHNAIQESNYTWALELLDFELSSSPSYPYEREDYQRHVMDLFPREITHTYCIINYIAGVLHESVNFAKVDDLFLDYGFDISKWRCEETMVI